MFLYVYFSLCSYSLCIFSSFFDVLRFCVFIILCMVFLFKHMINQKTYLYVSMLYPYLLYMFFFVFYYLIYFVSTYIYIYIYIHICIYLMMSFTNAKYIRWLFDFTPHHKLCVWSSFCMLSSFSARCTFHRLHVLIVTFIFLVVESMFFFTLYTYTFWLFHVAMENDPFINVFPAWKLHVY